MLTGGSGDQPPMLGVVAQTSHQQRPGAWISGPVPLGRLAGGASVVSSREAV
jgi:hypothetical protein